MSIRRNIRLKRHYGIRTADFKLIHFYNDVDEWEMYDLKNDPNELNNVFDKPEYADKRTELMSLLKRNPKSSIRMMIRMKR